MTGTSRRRYVLVALVALLVVGGIVAIRLTSDDSPSTGHTAATADASGKPGPSAAGDGAGQDAPVIMPGRPGESASVASPGTQVAPNQPRYNTMDAEYIRMMIPHHSQALQMTELVPDRASDPRLKVLAGRIKDTQGPEILRMRGWLESHGLDPDEDKRRGHDHGTMAGMQSPEAIARLTAARGVEFDRLFIEMMTNHHQGAIDMSIALLKVGVDIIVEEIATAVASEQNIEIQRMRGLLPA
ncbi:uncharacterized protein (DUF305 family) [Micromonospora pisi]|uniref:Uncharacterized protein (DUF305 family) n=1 Tax=Micromonospora pisi TaxID=589240 RepID=A0A495JWG4_9ACTN|nr:DUF305 domain-containing protein [Micromonospora pisi]RKR92509.1 uncharacterized protein (DUF305 family) [Micromonospora pisi]